jgi:hypothetical protein
MKIFSEKTKLFYPTVADCEAAEAEFDAKMAKIEAEKKALADARKERAKEVEAAFLASREAEKKYLELRNAFVKDFGSFHMTIRNQEIPYPFDDLFKYFF